MKALITGISAIALFSAAPALAQSGTTSDSKPVTAQQSGSPVTNENKPQADGTTAMQSDKMNKSASMAGLRASNIMGASIMNADNEAIGDVNDIVLSREGKIEKVIVGVGGFLGMGERSVAITMEQLQFTRGDNDSLTVKTQLTKNELTALPVWEPQQG
ncbi:MAG: PRC-barrel domain-containing protein [Pseudomonadota bacterium]